MCFTPTQSFVTVSPLQSIMIETCFVSAAGRAAADRWEGRNYAVTVSDLHAIIPVNGKAIRNGVGLRGRSNSVSKTVASANQILSMSTPRLAFERNWRLYIFEGIELAIFMISACVFTVFLDDPSYPAFHLIPNAVIRRLLMGIAMGITAVMIIRSPVGKRSGAHFNPAITLTYLRLGKIDAWDALFYVMFQFMGGVFGVAVSAAVLRSSLADPSVDYAVTVPGQYGTAAAFLAELFMATLLMGAVLWISNRPAIANYTSYCVGILITLYILLFAPVSGFSINPARTTGSAVFADVWTAEWLYFIAPLLGMMIAAETYLRFYGADRILCAKLHPDPKYPCPFLCHYPLHRHEPEPPIEA
jgi:aquaporin Z